MLHHRWRVGQEVWILAHRAHQPLPPRAVRGEHSEVRRVVRKARRAVRDLTTRLATAACRRCMLVDEVVSEGAPTEVPCPLQTALRTLRDSSWRSRLRPYYFLGAEYQAANRFLHRRGCNRYVGSRPEDAPNRRSETSWPDHVLLPGQVISHGSSEAALFCVVAASAGQSAT